MQPDLFGTSEEPPLDLCKVETVEEPANRLVLTKDVLKFGN